MSGGDVVVLIVAAAVIYAVTSSVVRSLFNPILRVDDEIRAEGAVAVVGPDVAALLGTARRVEFSIPTADTYQLAYRVYPGWSIALGVVLFPIGLLAVYVARERLVLTVTVSPDGEGTRIHVCGRVHKKLAQGIGRALQIQVRPQAPTL